MDINEYLHDPCRASALPYWKTVRIAIPSNLSVVRDDSYSPAEYPGIDEPYFKLRHDLETPAAAPLPDVFVWTDCSLSCFASHILECYPDTDLTKETLNEYLTHPVYDPALWIAAEEVKSGRIVASGIAELDTRIGEGVLEWIQVSEDYRRRGLGRCLVCELLSRMKSRARFVTVSGRMNSPSDPLSLYEACGFRDRTVWHIVTKT